MSSSSVTYGLPNNLGVGLESEPEPDDLRVSQVEGSGPRRWLAMAHAHARRESSAETRRGTGGNSVKEKFPSTVASILLQTCTGSRCMMGEARGEGRRREGSHSTSHSHSVVPNQGAGTWPGPPRWCETLRADQDVPRRPSHGQSPPTTLGNTWGLLRGGGRTEAGHVRASAVSLLLVEDSIIESIHQQHNRARRRAPPPPVEAAAPPAATMPPALLACPPRRDHLRRLVHFFSCL